jgi:hypothetical protein
MSDAMKYSARETFLWLNHAKELDKTLGKSASRSKAIQDYCKVRQSLDAARAKMIRLVRQEASLDALSKSASRSGKILVGDRRLDERKVALQIVKSSGSLQHRVVSIAIETARQQNDFKFFKALANAGLGKRVPEVDFERISVVPRFLVDYWCGDRSWPQGRYGRWIEWLNDFGNWKDGAFVWKKYQPLFFYPPLCFFSNGALATFLAFALGKEQSDADTSTLAVRQWVSRLGLIRASTPKIKEVRNDADEIYFEL